MSAASTGTRESSEASLRVIADRIALPAILLLGAALRLYDLGTKSLWGDEIAHFQGAINANSPIAIIQLAASHARPPLSYFVFNLYYKAISFLGLSLDKDLVAHIPSAIFGILAILAAYRFATAMFSRKEGLISAFLVSISTILIWSSQEARESAMLVFFSILSMHYFYRAITTDKREAWLLYVVATLLAVTTHSFALFIMLAQALFLGASWVLKLGFTREAFSKVDLRTVIKASVSMLVVFLVFVPFLSFLWHWATGSSPGRTPPPLSLPSLLAMWAELSVFTDFNKYVWVPATFHPASIAFLALAAAGLLFTIVKREFEGLYLLFLSLVLFFIVFFVFTFKSEYLRVRFAIFLSPPLLILVSRGVIGVARGVVPAFVRGRGLYDAASSMIVVVLLLFLSILSAQPVQSILTREKVNFKGAAQYIESRMGDGDIVTYGDVNTEFGMEYYLKGIAGSPLQTNQSGIWYVNAFGPDPADPGFHLVAIFPGVSRIFVYYEKTGSNFRLLPLTNPSFELEDGHGGVQGWKGAQWTGTVDYTLDRSAFADGTTSIKLETRSTDVNFGLIDEPIPVVAGKAFYVSGKTKAGAEGVSSRMEVQFLDSEKREIGVRGAETVRRGDWSQVALKGIVPSGAAYAVVRLRIDGSQSPGGVVWFDDVKFYGDWDPQPGSAPSPTLAPKWAPGEDNAKVVPNGGFEEDKKVPGMPDGWAGAQWAGSTDYSIDGSVFAEGKRSVRLETKSAGVNFGLISQPLPVTAGKEYYLSGEMKKDEGAIPSGIEIQFLGPDGGQVGMGTAEVVKAGEWTELGVQGVVPARASRAVVRLRTYGSQNTGGTVWFDDIKLYGDWVD